MTTYDSVAISTASGDGAGQWTGATLSSVGLGVQGGVDPAYPRGGSTAIAALSATIDGSWDGQGPVVPSVVVRVLQAVKTGTWDGQGPVWVGRFIPMSAVYRNADRLTIAGFATDLAGMPLRQVQLQFIGETVQQHFFGSGTDGNGFYVAYLEIGDTYAAYAYHPLSGTVWKMDHQTALPNRTDLVFRQVTKRGGQDGLFLRSG